MHQGGLQTGAHVSQLLHECACSPRVAAEVGSFPTVERKPIIIQQKEKKESVALTISDHMGAPKMFFVL